MKAFWLSKMFWVNVLAVLLAVVSYVVGFEIPAEVTMAVLGVINVILRAVTKQELSWGDTGAGKAVTGLVVLMLLQGALFVQGCVKSRSTADAACDAVTTDTVQPADSAGVLAADAMDMAMRKAAAPLVAMMMLQDLAGNEPLASFVELDGELYVMVLADELKTGQPDYLHLDDHVLDLVDEEGNELRALLLKCPHDQGASQQTDQSAVARTTLMPPAWSVFCALEA